MPTCLTSTGVTFPDSTSQATAIACGTRVRQYVAPATWTKPTGLTGVVVTVVGGGGGSGGAGYVDLGYATSPRQTGSGGCGGTVGGTAFNMYIPAPNIPGPVAVTVGAAGAGGPMPPTNAQTSGQPGGTSSFGCYASGTGGGGSGPGGAGPNGSGTIVAPLCGIGPTGGGNIVRQAYVFGDTGAGGAGVNSQGATCAGRPGTAGYVTVTEYY